MIRARAIDMYLYRVYRLTHYGMYVFIFLRVVSQIAVGFVAILFTSESRKCWLIEHYWTIVPRSVGIKTIHWSMYIFIYLCVCVCYYATVFFSFLGHKLKLKGSRRGTMESACDKWETLRLIYIVLGIFGTISHHIKSICACEWVVIYL